MPSSPHSVDCPNEQDQTHNIIGEQVLEEKTIISNSNGSHEEKKQYAAEPTESVLSISPSPSHNDGGISSSSEEDEVDNLETNPIEPPYTVFTTSQKRFIVLLAACAGFFSAVSITSNLGLCQPINTLKDLSQYLFPCLELSHKRVSCLFGWDSSL